LWAPASPGPDGRDVMVMNGKRTTYSEFARVRPELLRDLSRAVSPLALIDFEQARARLDRMAKSPGCGGTSARRPAHPLRAGDEAVWAAEPAGFVERVWANEEWTRGCYGCLMTTGGWTEYGRALREPVGRLHWAGAETATVWNGYMDGAVQSGERAAAEVLGNLA
jgi:hypothetical protein